MKCLKVFLTLLVLPAALWAQQPEEAFDFANYQDMRARLGTLYNEGRFEESVRLLEWALDKFPDNRLANYYNLALMYTRLEQPEKAVDALLAALDGGVWFGAYAFDDGLFDPLRETARFEEFLSRNAEKRREAQKGVVSEYSVLTPAGYQENRKYPLFIALHGGGGNMTEFKEVWKSNLLEKEFITLFVQSSQIVSMNGYSWTEDLEISKQEIKKAYDEVLKKYPVDEKEVIVGGFSSGGVASLEIALCNTLPVKGFVVLCPAKPESFTDENVAAAKARGIRGTILTTEMDGRLDSQKEMEAIMKKTGLPHRFFVTPNIGHWFPEDLDVQIDESIAHIRNRD